MNIFRCTICGEVHIGEEKPSDCPFCGVKSMYIKNSKDVNGKEVFKIKDMSQESIERLMTALNLETSNASFYKCASEKSESEEARAIFKRLANIEHEHADVIRKYLGLDSIEFQNEECFIQDFDNLTEAKDREKRAIKFYKEAMVKSREVKISTFFRALIDVEEGHEKIIKKSMK